MARLIVGLYDRFADAQAAVEELEAQGFAAEEMNVISGGCEPAVNAGEANSTQAASGAVIGAGAGAVLGGLLAGLAAFTIPGVGAVLAVGSIAAAWAGAGAGAIAGSVIGGLLGLGLEREDAYTLEQAIRRGGTVVAVRAEEDRAQYVMEIMDRHHVADLTDREARESKVEFGEMPIIPMPDAINEQDFVGHYEANDREQSQGV